MVQRVSKLYASFVSVEIAYLVETKLMCMSSYVLVKYLHFISIFSMVSLLVVELFLLKPQMTRQELKRLSRIDGLYGIASIAVVAAGLTLWFGVGKGAAFYANPLLYIKVGIVIVVGLVSIIPTVYYIRQGKGDPAEQTDTPRHIRQLVILQLSILSVVPLLATMMAQGLGLGMK
jgi:putative membrane protein